MSRLSVLVVACVLGLGARAQVNREIDRSEDLLAVDSFDNEVSFYILYSLLQTFSTPNIFQIIVARPSFKKVKWIHTPLLYFNIILQAPFRKHSATRFGSGRNQVITQDYIYTISTISTPGEHQGQVPQAGSRPLPRQAPAQQDARRRELQLQVSVDSVEFR